MPANRLIGILMTGMGNDGAEAMALIHAGGGKTIAEAEGHSHRLGYAGRTGQGKRGRFCCATPQDCSPVEQIGELMPLVRKPSSPTVPTPDDRRISEMLIGGSVEERWTAARNAPTLPNALLLLTDALSKERTPRVRRSYPDCSCQDRLPRKRRGYPPLLAFRRCGAANRGS